MFKLISGLMIFYVALTIFVAAMNGSGGINTTVLAQNVAVGNTTIYVSDVSGFLDSDYIVVDGEQMTYSSLDSSANTFTLSSGAVNSHKLNAMVYSPETSVLNNALGVNVGSVSTTAGIMAIPISFYKFFTNTLPALVTLTLPVSGDFAWVGYLWVAMTTGALFAIIGYLGWIAWNIVKPN